MTVKRTVRSIVDEALRQVVGERDRYKLALERITRLGPSDQSAARIAREALAHAQDDEHQDDEHDHDQQRGHA